MQLIYVAPQLPHLVSQLTYVDLQLTYVDPQLAHVLFHAVKAVIHAVKAVVHAVKAFIHAVKAVVHAVKTPLKTRLSLFQVSHAVGQAIELAGKIHYPGQAQSQHANKKRPNLQPAHTCHIFHNFYDFPIMFAATL